MSVMKGTIEDECEPREIASEPESQTVNTDTERNGRQDTAGVDINAPEEKHSDSAAEVVHMPVYTEGRKSTASVNIERELKFQCLMLKSRNVSLTKMM